MPMRSCSFAQSELRYSSTSRMAKIINTSNKNRLSQTTIRLTSGLRADFILFAYILTNGSAFFPVGSEDFRHGEHAGTLACNFLSSLFEFRFFHFFAFPFAKVATGHMPPFLVLL